MRLVQYFRPLLDLGSCKEYVMASKAGNGVRKPRKASSVQTPVTGNVNAPVNGTVTEAKSAVPTGLEEQIRRRAYEIYLQRGATPGGANEDWIVAEREVRSTGIESSAHH